MQETDWLDGDEKPARIGVYKRRILTHIAFSYWNGTFWGKQNTKCAERAYRSRRNRSAFQSLPWRGLAEDPASSIRTITPNGSVFEDL